MHHKQFEIGTVPLSQNEFDTIEIGSLEHCGTSEESTSKSLKYIVTASRPGVYGIFLASAKVCRYHVATAKKFGQNNSAVVGGGSIDLKSENNEITMVTELFQWRSVVCHKKLDIRF